MICVDIITPPYFPLPHGQQLLEGLVDALLCFLPVLFDAELLLHHPICQILPLLVMNLDVGSLPGHPRVPLAILLEEGHHDVVIPINDVLLPGAYNGTELLVGRIIHLAKLVDVLKAERVHVFDKLGADRDNHVLLDLRLLLRQVDLRVAPIDIPDRHALLDPVICRLAALGDSLALLARDDDLFLLLDALLNLNIRGERREDIDAGQEPVGHNRQHLVRVGRFVRCLVGALGWVLAFAKRPQAVERFADADLGFSFVLADALLIGLALVGLALVGLLPPQRGPFLKQPISEVLALLVINLDIALLAAIAILFEQCELHVVIAIHYVFFSRADDYPQTLDVFAVMLVELRDVFKAQGVDLDQFRRDADDHVLLDDNLPFG
mmetsp:Transcript_135629/g.343244  ORF Transcript_135629/g.343244 Transcript_135629/m.343244 type:complete len:380 (+) Transcript_135629:131-1270(+)